jgi:3-mercaptopyruvate sulfurtransferase SseA
VRYRFVDCRWELGAPGRGRELYLAGHVPGASFLDVDEDLADPPGPAGRHPLPSAEDFALAASRAGIEAGVFVVAYGTMGGAERLWWLLRHFGHDDCAVFELEAWHGPLRSGEEEVEPGEFVPRPRDGDTISAEELAAHLDELVVVDARLPARFRGAHRPPRQALPRLLERVGAARPAGHARLKVTVSLASTSCVPGSTGVSAASAALSRYGRGGSDSAPSSIRSTCPRLVPASAASAFAFARASPNARRRALR